MAFPKVVCAWCTSVMREGALPISHGICPPCQDRLEAESYDLQVAFPSGRQETLSFPSALSRLIAAIALAAQPVVVKIVGGGQ